jgi:protein-L-isoaspartate(D-aspartate) O-methyltransferase
LAARRGIEVPRQIEAIGRICVWLDQWRTGTGTQAWWPELISRREYTAGTTRQAGPGRPSWCYGTPGLARAQQLAGHVLGDLRRKLDAELALAGCLADPRQLDQVTDASLCHGWAGLLHATFRVAADATDPDRFNQQRILDRAHQFIEEGVRSTDDGLLTGATGTQLALHTATVGTPPLSRWDACLLLDAGRPDPHADNQTATHRALAKWRGTAGKDIMNDTITDSPETLRARMVDRITAAGWAHTPRVAQAMRSVPRHLFVPDAPLIEAYDDRAVIIKRGPDGKALSCASEPVVVAMMLDQLDIHPGQNVLEIGAGTGYNAALLADLAGPTGQVTTVDIDPEVTAKARRNLDTTGHRQVQVATRDGALGDPDHAPYDRIILTVGAWDIPTAWWDQLTPSGRLVVPLRWRGQTRSIAFTHTDGLMRSDSVQLCGFVPMLGQNGEHTTHLDTHGHVELCWDEDQHIQPAALAGVLDRPQTSVWSGLSVGGDEPFDGIWLRLTATEPGTCRITASAEAIDAGLLHRPAIPARSPALVDGGSLAYLTLRRLTPQGAPASRWELGAAAYGPAGAQLAWRLCVQVRAWDSARAAQPIITLAPHLDREPRPTGLAIHKGANSLTVSY